MKRLLSIAASAALVAAANADFANGSFENGGGSFSSWTTQNGSVSSLGILAGTFIGMDGLVVATFTGPNASTISQTLTTVNNQNYVLSFHAGILKGPNSGIGSENLEVTQNGSTSIYNAPVAYVNNGSGDELSSYSYNVTGTGTDTFVFAGYDANLAITKLMLDDIHLTAVPEPSPMILFGMGFVGLVIRRRRVASSE